MRSSVLGTREEVSSVRDGPEETGRFKDPRGKGIAFLEWPATLLSHVSRRENSSPFFLGVVFCMAWRMGDFPWTGRVMGESGVRETTASLAFSFTLIGRPFIPPDRLRFRAYSGRFTL